MNEDQQQLHLLGIFWYVFGALAGLCSCLPLVHVGMGIAMLTGNFPHRPDQPFPEKAFGGLIIVFASAFILLGWAFSACMIVTARFLHRHKHYTFCLVLAALLCMQAPFGTVLGVFTILVLARPSVQEIFAREKARARAAAAPPPPPPSETPTVE
jgi:hypothetical protein